MTLELYMFYIALFVSFLLDSMDFRYLIAWKYISGPIDKEPSEERGIVNI